MDLLHVRTVGLPIVGTFLKESEHSTMYCIYSPIGTLRDKDSISTKDTALGPKKYCLPIVPIHFYPPKENNLLTVDKRGCLEMSLIQKFHCTC